MTVTAQWLRVLDSLSLPQEARVLVCSPDDEGAVLSALGQCRPFAKAVGLDLAGRGRLRPRAGEHRAAERVSQQEVSSTGGARSGSFDAVLFDHALDDMIADAVARHEGIEDGDRAAATRAVRAYWRSGELEGVVRPPLIGLVRACAGSLGRAAPIIFCHRVAPAHLPDQPMDLYIDCLALARSWLLQANLGLREMPLDGFDSHWWMRLVVAP